MAACHMRFCDSAEPRPDLERELRQRRLTASDQLRTIRLDITEALAMPSAIAEAWEAFGRIDIVVPDRVWQGRNREGRP
jgi:NAD(P)-dependent dehydrogenase (short-subunit alcohol dehydrogenase family)